MLAPVVRAGPVAALVRGCHPEPTVAVTAITTLLAHTAGARTGWVAAAFLTGQLATGWSNDWVDSDRDVRTARADKPVVQGRLAPRTLLVAAAVALVLCVPLSLAMGTYAGILHLLAVASALSYNAGLKGTPLSWAPYALSFGLIPSIVTHGAGHGWAAPSVSAAGALLGIGAHLANALPDLADDEATGVRGLPHRLGAGPAAALAVVLLLAATALLAAGAGRRGGVALGVAAVVTVGGLVLARRPGSRAAFLAVIVVAAVDVALLLTRGASLG